jgi:hypothetical protein
MSNMLSLAETLCGEIALVLLFSTAPLMSAVSAFCIGKVTRWYLGLLAFIPICYTLVYFSFVLADRFMHPVR